MPVPEEIPVNLMQDEPVVQGTVNLFGPASAEEIAGIDNREKRDDDYTDLVTEALPLDNFAVNFYDYIVRKNKHEVDPDFNIEGYMPALTAGIPSVWHSKFAGAASLDEAMEIRDTIQSEMQAAEKLSDNGITGSLARMTAGAFDADLAIPFIGPAKKMHVLARAARAGLYGAGTAAVTESGLAMVGETNDWSTVPVAALMGLTVGAAIGAVNPKIGLTTQIVDAEDFLSPKANVLRSVYWDAETPHGTASVSRRAAQDLVDNSLDTDAMRLLDGTDHLINEYTGARVFAGNEGTMGERAADFVQGLNTRAALNSGWASRFRDSIAAGPLHDDATRLWNTGSNTLRALTVSLFEFADAFVVNNRSGAVLQDFLFGHTYKVFDEVYDKVALAGFKAKGIGALDFKAKAAHLTDFNRRVLMQANDLNLGRKVQLDTDVADVVAGLKDLAEKFRREGAGGSAGARPVPGFETLAAKAAYFPMPWHPERLRAVINEWGDKLGSSRKGREKVVGSIKRAYMHANPDMEEGVAEQVARALVRRQLAKGDLMDTNIEAMLHTDDARAFLKEALTDNGIADDVAEDLLDRIRAGDKDKGKVSYGRKRTDIDLAGEFDGIKIIDLVDPDVKGSIMRYSDTMTKRIALSRHGIDSKRKMVAIKEHVLSKELPHMDTTSKAEIGKLIDYMFEYFEPGTVDKHINPFMRRAKASVGVSLLSKLGLTQAAETGAIVAATGIRNFVRASKVMQEASKGLHAKALMDDFGFLVGNLAYDKGLMRTDFVSESALDIVSSSSKLMRDFDNMLVKGQHMQSVVSGYTKVIEAQLNLGAIAATNKIFRGLRAGIDMQDMFESMGLPKSSRASLSKLIDTGVIEFNAAGHVERLNVHKWGDRIREDYGLASVRLSRQMTQRALAGESIQWLHDPSWAIFGHLQSFALLAMRKQFLRNAGRKDGHLLALATWGLGTAALAGIVGAAMEGTEDGLTAEHIAKRAFALNNAFGWIAPGVNLFASITGLEEYSPGGRYARDITIPLLSVASRAIGIPKAIAGLAPGAEFTNADKRAMQVVPVVGSMFFMNRVWDAARTDE